MISIMSRTLQTLAASIVLLLFPITCWPQGSAATDPINALERSALSPPASMIELGKNVAGTTCASCHGINGVSTQPGIPHLAGQRTVYLHRVLQAYQSRERHNDAMNHATGFLNEEALLAVAAYYAALAPARPHYRPKIQMRPWRLAGRSLRRYPRCDEKMREMPR